MQKTKTELILKSPKTVAVSKESIPHNWPTVTAKIDNSLRNFTCIVYLTCIPIQTLGVRNCYPKTFVSSAAKDTVLCWDLVRSAPESAVLPRDFICSAPKNAVFSRDFVCPQKCCFSRFFFSLCTQKCHFSKDFVCSPPKSAVYPRDFARCAP